MTTIEVFVCAVCSVERSTIATCICGTNLCPACFGKAFNNFTPATQYSVPSCPTCSTRWCLPDAVLTLSPMTRDTFLVESMAGALFRAFNAGKICDLTAPPVSFPADMLLDSSSWNAYHIRFLELNADHPDVSTIAHYVQITAIRDYIRSPRFADILRKRGRAGATLRETHSKKVPIINDMRTFVKSEIQAYEIILLLDSYMKHITALLLEVHESTTGLGRVEDWMTIHGAKVALDNIMFADKIETLRTTLSTQVASFISPSNTKLIASLADPLNINLDDLFLK